MQDSKGVVATRQTTAEELQNLYWDQQLSTRQIARLFNRSQCWVRSELNKHHIHCRPAHGPELYHLDLSEIRRLYLDEKLSTSAIAKRLGISQPIVWHKLHRLGITRNLRNAMRVWWNSNESGDLELNESFFDVWTPESAWVLGWILSDGHITNRVLDFKIHERDAEILYKVKELLSTNVLVKQVHGKQAVRLQISSRKLLNACHNLLNSYAAMPKACLGHFIRGFFEGDGCVTRINHTGTEVYFDNANPELLKSLWDLLKDNAIVTGGAIRQDSRGKDWQLRFVRKSDCYHLYHLMYGDLPSFCLLRKKTRFEQLMGSYLDRLPMAIGG